MGEILCRWLCLHIKTVLFLPFLSTLFFLPFSFFLCNCTGKDSSGILNGSSEHEHPCLFLILENSLSLLNILLTVGFLYRCFEEIPFCSEIAKSVYHDKPLNFVKVFSCIHWADDKTSLSLILLVWCINIIGWFLNIEWTFNSWAKSYQVIISHFYMLLASILVRILCLCS